jgi:hypothetical protein
MRFWKGPRRKSQKGKVRNDTVRTTVDVEKKELKVSEEKSYDSLDM